jgi:predicted PurR-regulated permease PerM
MLKVLLGSQIGIMSIVTVVGAILVVAVWSVYMYVKASKEK